MRLAILLAGALSLLGTGCVRRTVVVHDEGPRPEPIHDAYSGDCWDGERWVVYHGHVHSAHCGHYYHHGAWHLYPVSHVYVHPGCHHWGVVVRVR